MSARENIELSLTRVMRMDAVPIEIVRAQKSAAAAFGLACSLSGLLDKEIYLSLGIDAGYFSSIKSGKGQIRPELIRDFCTLVGNTVYPEWIAYQLGCTLVMTRTEAERRAEEAEIRVAALEVENKMMRQLLQGRVT